MHSHRIQLFGLIALCCVGHSGRRFNCRDYLDKSRGRGVAKLEHVIRYFTRNEGYEGSELSIGGQRFEVVAGSLGQGIYGIVYELRPLSFPSAAMRKLLPSFISADGFSWKPLVVKVAHRVGSPLLSRVYFEAKLIQDAEAEHQILTVARNLKNIHPAYTPTILFADIQHSPPFLVKLRSSGIPFTEYKSISELSAEQLTDLAWLYRSTEDIFNHSKSRGLKISPDIKPANLSWEGEHWGFYEISRMPSDNNYFLRKGFSAYLQLSDGYLFQKHRDR